MEIKQYEYNNQINKNKLIQFHNFILYGLRRIKNDA